MWRQRAKSLSPSSLHLIAGGGEGSIPQTVSEPRSIRKNVRFMFWRKWDEEKRNWMWQGAVSSLHLPSLTQRKGSPVSPRVQTQQTGSDRAEHIWVLLTVWKALGSATTPWEGMLYLPRLEQSGLPSAAPFHKLHPRIHPRKLETSEVCLSHFHLSFLPVCTQSNYINSSLRNVSQTHMLTDLLFVKILFH